MLTGLPAVRECDSRCDSPADITTAGAPPGYRAERERWRVTLSSGYFCLSLISAQVVIFEKRKSPPSNIGSSEAPMPSVGYLVAIIIDNKPISAKGINSVVHAETAEIIKGEGLAHRGVVVSKSKNC